MKILLYITAILFCFTTMAKGKGTTAKMMVDSAKSKVSWTGSKKIGDKHVGHVKIKSGHVTTAANKLTGGEFEIDMNSITNTDVKSPEYNGKLVGHLKSPDFFDTKNHPTAKFVITKVTPKKGTNYTIEGKMTIRGKTNTEKFDATITNAGKAMTAKGTLEFNRLKYGVTYNSETNILKKAVKIAKDKIITDTVNLSFDLATVSK